ncbi:MAG: acyl-CoA dehydrogenase family protein, partial [Parvibaculaceae bacterium]|nr:acyl-CoA dehydrogenase family protein [Parvibaculaceae bacterium]
PILFAGGLRSIGPLLIEMGTPEQKEWYLPAILSGDDLWCQGFSEPNAGSDLAALHIAAKSDGDDFVLNGSKLWTTGAHLANRMFCLVRTAKGERPQQGISFLLLDMDTPGITIEPIAMLTGEYEFNQVRFDDVRVPKKNLVGLENEGWAVAKSLMRHARASNTTSSHLHRAFAALQKLRSEMQMDPEPGLLTTFYELQIELDAFDGLELRTRHAAYNGQGDAQEKAAASVLKLTATELHQKITQVGMCLAGPYAMVQQGAGSNEAYMAKEGALATAKYLGLRAATIYSGTSEIHRNLLMAHLEKGASLLSALP